MRHILEMMVANQQDEEISFLFNQILKVARQLINADIKEDEGPKTGLGAERGQKSNSC